VEEMRPGAIARADTLFRTERLPWCPEIFRATRGPVLSEEALARRPPQDLGRDPAADQPPGARVADEAAPLDDDPAAEDRGHGPALDRPALPRAVVAHVKILARERLKDRRIDEDEVRVAPGGDDTLLRIEPENPPRVRRRP